MYVRVCAATQREALEATPLRALARRSDGHLIQVAKLATTEAPDRLTLDGEL
jgi:hypothetical protein